MTNKFNRENVLSTLAQIVDEYGADHVYDRTDGQCFYSNEDGTPSCIVGHIIYRLQPDVYQEIHEWEWGNGEENYAQTTCRFHQLGDNGFELDYENGSEAHFLITALKNGQFQQDHAQTWGYAEDIIRATLGEEPRHDD